MYTKLKNIIPQILLISLLVLNSCSNSCVVEDGSLDEVKNYVKEDKYFKSGLKGLHFVIETDPISDVEKMFSRILKTYKLPVEAEGLPDGTFTGESPYDAFDYKHVVELTIKDGKITSVVYNEIHKDGSDKKTDKAYNDEMSISGTTPSVAYPIMEKQLIEKQNMLEVDAVSGASYSLYRFRYATFLALTKAKLKKGD